MLKQLRSQETDGDEKAHEEQKKPSHFIPSAKTLESGVQDIDVLLKLLPFYDLDLSKRTRIQSRSTDEEKVAQARKLLSIERSHAEMIKKKFGICSLSELIGHFFDRLIVPD